MVKECKIHGLTTHYPRKDESGARCGKCLYALVKKRRYKIKGQLVEFFGGKCIECGYNKSHKALQFHHRDPKEKEFQISEMYTRRSLDALVVEAEKCDLICANCHAEKLD